MTSFDTGTQKSVVPAGVTALTFTSNSAPTLKPSKIMVDCVVSKVDPDVQTKKILI